MKAVLTLHIISSILFNRRRPCWQWSKPDYPILSILFLLMFSGNLRRQGISRHGIVSHSWNIPSQASLKMSNVGSSLSLEGTQMNVVYSIICEYCIIFGVWSQSLKRSSKIENGNDKLTLKIFNCSHFKFIIISIYWHGNGTFCTRTSNSLMISNKGTLYKYKHTKNQLMLAITWSREQGIAFSYCMMSCCRVMILWTENELLFLIS